MTDFYEQQFKGRSLEEMSSGTDLEGPEGIETLEEANSTAIQRISRTSPINVVPESRNLIQIIHAPVNLALPENDSGQNKTNTVTFLKSVSHLLNLLKSRASFIKTYDFLKDFNISLNENDTNVSLPFDINDLKSELKSSISDYIGVMSENHSDRSFDIGDGVWFTKSGSNSLYCSYLGLRDLAFPLNSEGYILNQKKGTLFVKFEKSKKVDWTQSKEYNEVLTNNMGDPSNVGAFSSSELKFMPINFLHKSALNNELNLLLNNLNPKESDLEKKANEASEVKLFPSPKAPEKYQGDLQTLFKIYRSHMHSGDNWYEKALNAVKNLNPTKEQIHEFSDSLQPYSYLKYFENKTASYISALIMSSPDKVFEIDVSKLNSQKFFLNKLGCNIENKVLTIHGSVGNELGYRLKNAKIFVTGNAGKKVGHESFNSGIYLNGNYQSLSPDIDSGTHIFQKQNDEWKLIAHG